MSTKTLTLAQRSNFLPVTPLGYAWWRAQSLTLLSGEPFGLEREARMFTALCRPHAGQRWLDAGTSTGFYAGALAAQGCRVDAADLSAGMLRRAAARTPSPLISWHQVNLEQSGWEPGIYDGVTVGATLNETADPARLLQELARLLRPGGGLWLMYVARAPGPAQAALTRLGGLWFPDLAWISRHLPDLWLEHASQHGAVQFALWRSLDLGASAG